MKTNRYSFSAYEVSELCEAFGDDRLDNALIEQARDRARLWIVPCQWEVKHKSDGSAVVIRYHN